jgi:perosamine synthetase
LKQQKLAIHGGEPVKKSDFQTGKRFGQEEVKELMEALDQNTLFYHHGTKVKTFINNFNEMYGVPYSVAASSGTAAIHIALGASGISEGDEVITSPITDQGTIVGILYQNAIPVFADLHPHSYNLDVQSIEERITPRTKAIIVVHLAGNPCMMDDIMELAHIHQLTVIEDCAQSYLTQYKGRLTGTIGNYGCFSTNDFKHISTGDGGIVTVNSGKWRDYESAHAFADKNYRRMEESVDRRVHHLAPNYRMTELQGAVGIAQLKKLKWICERRTVIGNKIGEAIANISGIVPHEVNEADICTYWFYMFRVESDKMSCSRDEFSEALRAEGIPNQAGYIPEPVYMQPLFQDKQAYPGSHYPFDLSEATYNEGICPVAESILKSAVRLPIKEFYSDQDVEDIISAIKKVAHFFKL